MSKLSQRVAGVTLVSGLALSAFSGIASADSPKNKLGIASADSPKNKLEFPITYLPQAIVPYKHRKISTYYNGISYQEATNENNDLCPITAFKEVNCTDGSAEFASCSIVSQPYKTWHNTIISVDLEKYEFTNYSRSEMMAAFMISNIHTEWEKKRIWFEQGKRFISAKEMEHLALSDSNTNQPINLEMDSKSLAIQRASYEFGQKCSVPEPVREAQQKEVPSAEELKPIPSAENILG